jgi:molybdopterin molybdotransferase
MKDRFFHVVDVATFRSLLRSFPAISRTERLPLEKACGRVLAEDVVAGEPIPPFTRSCMDGYAVSAADTFGASESIPAYLDIAGSVEVQRSPAFRLERGQCAAVVTGSCLPEGADSVVMQEHSHILAEGSLQVARAVAPGENVLYRGEDCESGDTAVAAHSVLLSGRVGILAALGVCTVQVFQQPRVGLVATGDELVPADQPVREAQIRDVNTHSVSCLLRQSGAVPVSYGIVSDNEAELADTLATAASECDLLLVSGGSSVGAMDITLDAMTRLPDFQLMAHGISISPGKPTILARSGDLPVIGLPGQVTSAQVVTMILIRPFLEYLQGKMDADREGIFLKQAILSRNVASKQGREDYVRIRLSEHEGERRADPILGPAGLLRTLLEADALLRIPDNVEGLEKGQTVQVHPLFSV